MEQHDLRVSGKTDPGKLAKSIAMTLQERESGKVRVRAMGPHAVNQACKGIAVARQHLAAHAYDIETVIAFDSSREGDEEISVLVFYLRLFRAV